MPKTVDHKNKMNGFFKDDLRRFINEDIYVGDLGRVTRYDKDTKRCDVQPLALQTDGDKRAQWIEAIVPSSIWQLDNVLGKLSDSWIPMRIGSVVRVAFLDRDSTEWTGKNNYKTNGRMHSVQDPIVAEVVQP